MSFVATAYPGMYLSPCIDARRPGVESNRVCVLPSTSFPAEDGSFKIIPGLSNASLFSFQCMSNVRVPVLSSFS